jgi:hypothetical protein
MALGRGDKREFLVSVLIVVSIHAPARGASSNRSTDLEPPAA